MNKGELGFIEVMVFGVVMAVAVTACFVASMVLTAWLGADAIMVCVAEGGEASTHTSQVVCKISSNETIKICTFKGDYWDCEIKDINLKHEVVKLSTK